MRAKQFCALTTTESRAKMAPVKCIYPPPPVAYAEVLLLLIFWFGLCTSYCSVLVFVLVCITLCPFQF